MANPVNGKRRDKKSCAEENPRDPMENTSLNTASMAYHTSSTVGDWNRLTRCQKARSRLLHSGRWKKPSEETSSHSLTRLAGI